MLETNFQKIYTTVLAKESIFYKTHSVSRQPVHFFFTLEGDDLGDEIRELGEGVGRESAKRGRNGCLDTHQRFSLNAAPWRTNNKPTKNISSRSRKEIQESSSGHADSKDKLVSGQVVQVRE